MRKSRKQRYSRRKRKTLSLDRELSDREYFWCFTFLTSILGIGYKSSWAEFTYRLVILDNAWRVGCACGKLARIDALELPASLASRTAGVAQANRYGWLAVAHANADWLVVLHLAGLVLGTDGSSAQGHDAGITALAIGAGHVRGAVIVAIALPLVRGARQFSVLIHYEARFADTNGLVASRLALLVALADEERIVARICALAVLAALQCLWTLGVCGAWDLLLGLWIRVLGHALGIRLALDLWPTDVATGAGAARSMQYGFAESIQTTHATHCTRIAAVSLEA